MKRVFLHLTEAKPPTGQPGDLIQLFSLRRVASLCDHTVVVVVLSFRHSRCIHFIPPGPIPSVIQTLFHLYLEIPFSHPFNLDGSFHTTVCTLPWQHNERQSVAPIRPGRLLSAEKLAARREPFVTNLRGGGMARSSDLFPAIFSPLTQDIFLAHTFQM